MVRSFHLPTVVAVLQEALKHDVDTHGFDLLALRTKLGENENSARTRTRSFDFPSSFKTGKTNPPPPPKSRLMPLSRLWVLLLPWRRRGLIVFVMRAARAHPQSQVKSSQAQSLRLVWGCLLFATLVLTAVRLRL